VPDPIGFVIRTSERKARARSGTEHLVLTYTLALTAGLRVWFGASFIGAANTIYGMQPSTHYR
jgi:hypothetical protein